MISGQLGRRVTVTLRLTGFGSRRRPVPWFLAAWVLDQLEVLVAKQRLLSTCLVGPRIGFLRPAVIVVFVATPSWWRAILMVPFVFGSSRSPETDGSSGKTEAGGNLAAGLVFPRVGLIIIGPPVVPVVPDLVVMHVVVVTVPPVISVVVFMPDDLQVILVLPPPRLADLVASLRLPTFAAFVFAVHLSRRPAMLFEVVGVD